MTQDEILQLVDQAARQTDRWWTAALFAILLSVFVVVWRFMVADRNKLGERLSKVTDEHIASCKSLSEVVANNTVALREVNDTIVRCRWNQNKP